jgi:NAD(P)-dependent dehydrogenase (short-subunit alcohol dehydrogenase family)
MIGAAAGTAGGMSTPTAPAERPTAVVVGGSRGLGLAVARELVEQGYRPVLLARDEAELDKARDELGHGTSTRTCDVRDRTRLAAVLGEVDAESPVEALFYVSGIITVAPAEELTLADFEESVDVMQLGMVAAVWAVLPAMRRRGRGRIGLVTSIGGRVAPPHLLAYSSAKFGAVGFGEGLAAELAGSGVTATVFAPGLMRTGGHEHAVFDGEPAREYGWFATAAGLPVVSADADHAARVFVRGVLAGRPHVSLTPLARIGYRVHGLAPATTVRLMGLANRLLPGPSRSGGRRAGRGIDREQHGPVKGAVLAMSRRAARRHGDRR